MWEAVRNYLANQRQGTSSVRHRGEIRGGGRKPFRQKGTGRARQGTSRSPLMVGGARAFGPHPRDYSYTLPKKVKRLALRSALSAKASALAGHPEEAVCVLAEVGAIDPRMGHAAGDMERRIERGRPPAFRF